MRDYIIAKGSFQYVASRYENELTFDAESDGPPERILLKFKYPDEELEFKNLFQAIYLDGIKTN